MRVFLAGATGALGRSLVPLLIQAGHEVTGTTRSAAKVADLNAAGAEGVVMDGLDAQSVAAAVRTARPDVIVHQQSALSDQSGNLKRFDRDFATTNRLRIEGTDHLLAVARETGVTRFVAQSFTGWPNARSGGPVKTEDDPLEPNPESACSQTLRGIQYLERVTTGTPGIDGLALRYGSFYGNGNRADQREVRRPSAQAAAADRRRRHRRMVRRTHRRRRAGHARGDRGRSTGHLQHRRRRPGAGRGCADDARRCVRREAAAPVAHLAGPATDRRLRRGVHDHTARLVERQGQARTGLEAGAPELAAGILRAVVARRPGRGRSFSGAAVRAGRGGVGRSSSGGRAGHGRGRPCA